MERSVSGISSEERPIIKTRRVAETGGMMTGGAAHVGSVGLTTARRSDTSCRARIRSVPGFMISVMEDNCGTDFERISARYHRPVALFQLELGAEQLSGADGHDRRTRRWDIGQDGHVTLYVIDSDRRADEGQRLRAGVDEGAPVNVI